MLKSAARVLKVSSERFYYRVYSSFFLMEMKRYDYYDSRCSARRPY